MNGTKLPVTTESAFLHSENIGSTRDLRTPYMLSRQADARASVSDWNLPARLFSPSENDLQLLSSEASAAVSLMM